MSPRVKRPRPELPQAIVRKGTVGSFPIQSWSLSALYHHRSESIIGFRDTEETLLYKSKSQVQLTISAKQQEPLVLSGKIFNGFSDALYRGHLPEVVLVCQPDEQRINFLNNLTDYLEQLVAMGFLGGRPVQLEADPVALYIPCFVLLGHGVWYSRMMTTLASFLKDLKCRASVLTPEMQQMILNRFVRGSASSDFEWIAANQTNFEPTQLPESIRIAGGSQLTQKIIQTALCTYGWKVEIENSMRNAAERLEFQDTAWRLSSIVIPELAEQKRLSTAEAKKLTPLVQQAILTIGCHREAFTHSEKIVRIELKMKPKDKTLLHSKSLTSITAEQDVLKGLSAYATALGLKQEKEIFDRLAARVSDENALI